MPEARRDRGRHRRKAPLAVAAAKRAAREGADLPLGAAIELERQLFAGLFATGRSERGHAGVLRREAPPAVARRRR